MIADQKKPLIKYHLFFKNRWTGKEFNIEHSYKSDKEMFKKIKINYHTEILNKCFKIVKGVKKQLKCI